jgi:hypothetical protein
MSHEITIKMSETAPVRIDTRDWPLIAQIDAHDGALKCQAATEWTMCVREHADGRRLVYGWQEAGNGGQYAGFEPTLAGFLVDALGAHCAERETVRAIRRVAGILKRDSLARDCIIALPATVLR